MSKRLQVVVRDEELRRFQRAARALGLTLSEWARQALRRAEQEVAPGHAGKKLDAIRRAVEFGDRAGVPSPDIDQMLAEIEQGYRQDLES